MSTLPLMTALVHDEAVEKAQVSVDAYVQRRGGKIVHVRSYRRDVLSRVIASLKRGETMTMPDGQRVRLGPDGRFQVHLKGEQTRSTTGTHPDRVAGKLLENSTSPEGKAELAVEKKPRYEDRHPRSAAAGRANAERARARWEEDQKRENPDAYSQNARTMREWPPEVAESPYYSKVANILLGNRTQYADGTELWRRRGSDGADDKWVVTTPGGSKHEFPVWDYGSVVKKLEELDPDSVMVSKESAHEVTVSQGQEPAGEQTSSIEAGSGEHDVRWHLRNGRPVRAHRQRGRGRRAPGQKGPGAQKNYRNRLTTAGNVLAVLGYRDGSDQERLAAFQAKHKIKPTGTPTPETMRLLRLEVGKVRDKRAKRRAAGKPVRKKPGKVLHPPGGE